MDLWERIGKCQGLELAAITAELADLDQDEVTRALVEAFGARTDQARLPARPYTVQHTLYGDDDVSEWLLGYGTDGAVEVREAEDADAPDLHVRWEHWEDAVRVLDDDVPALALLYGRRVTVEGIEPSTGEPPWFDAVDFTGSDAEAMGHMLGELTAARLAGRKEHAEVVARVGVERIAAGAGLMAAHTLVDNGSARELAGSYMRLVIAGDPPVVVQVDFDAATGHPSVRLPGPAGDDGDLDGGVTLRYSSPAAAVAGADGESTFDQLLVNGLVRMEGAQPRIEAFGGALIKLAELYGLR
jgi:hypothetical protein